MGIMLETVSERLLARGMAHDRAPDKVPARRLQDDRAGRQARHPVHDRPPDRHRRDARASAWTRSSPSATCTRRTATSRRSSSRTSVPSRGSRCAMRAEPSLEDLLWTLAVARLVLGPDVNIQAPPNLSPDVYPAAPGGGPQRLGRHLAADPRSHQPRETVAADPRAPARDREPGLRPARASRDLSGVRDARRVPGREPARARPGPGRRARSRQGIP